jgi:trehalose 6-phosphate phosphatase
VRATTLEVASVHLPHPRDELAVSPASDAFLFDLDGTLIDIAPTPGAVVIPAGLPDVLSSIRQRASGALAVISGRPVRDIDRLLPGLGLAAAGDHGASIRMPGEHAPSGHAVPHASLVALEEVWDRVSDWAKARPGILLERKAWSVALHYRNRPDLAEPASRLTVQLAQEMTPAIVRQPGGMVEELRIAGPDKGDALRTIMQSALFQGRRPFFFGDDLTDEAAFRAAAAMGGGGVIVGPGRERTAAVAALASPTDLRLYLEEILWR